MKYISAILLIELFFIAGQVQAQEGIPNKSTAIGTPIGTVITSLLDFDRFQHSVGEDPTKWNPKTSAWAPADGREVSGSDFARAFYTGKDDHYYPCTTNPSSNRFCLSDMRGIFIRGLNNFDQRLTTRGDQFKDPDSNRKPGSLQMDTFTSHNHTFRRWKDVAGGAGRQGKGYHVDDWTDTTDKKGGSETRPKNIAVYYYVRIN